LVLEDVVITDVHQELIASLRISKGFQLAVIETTYAQVLSEVRFLREPFLLINAAETVPETTQILVFLHVFVINSVKLV